MLTDKEINKYIKEAVHSSHPVKEITTLIAIIKEDELRRTNSIKKYYRANEIAKKYDIGLSTVWWYVKKGYLTPIKLSTRVTVFDINIVDRVLGEVQALIKKVNKEPTIYNISEKATEDLKSLSIDILQELKTRDY
jgi:hypothetical protein